VKKNKEKDVLVKVTPNTRGILKMAALENGMTLKDYLAHMAWKITNNK